MLFQISSFGFPRLSTGCQRVVNGCQTKLSKVTNQPLDTKPSRCIDTKPSLDANHRGIQRWLGIMHRDGLISSIFKHLWRFCSSPSFWDSPQILQAFANYPQITPNMSNVSKLLCKYCLDSIRFARPHQPIVCLHFAHGEVTMMKHNIVEPSEWTQNNENDVVKTTSIFAKRNLMSSKITMETSLAAARWLVLVLKLIISRQRFSNDLGSSH